MEETIRLIGRWSDYPVSISNCGLTFRNPTDGPEFEMLLNFIGDGISPVRKGRQRILFVEPRLESGFPDLVLVDVNPRVYSNWKRERRPLSKSELRVLHYLYTQGLQTMEELQSVLGRDVVSSMEHLHDAGMVAKKRGLWQVKNAEQTFAIRNLTAFEAKLSDQWRGLEQALQNRWFSFDSYLLIGRTPGTDLCLQAEHWGVGVLVSNGRKRSQVVEAQCKKQPISYASWLFNEWAWIASTS